MTSRRRGCDTSLVWTDGFCEHHSDYSDEVDSIDGGRTCFKSCNERIRALQNGAAPDERAMEAAVSLLHGLVVVLFALGRCDEKVVILERNISEAMT